MAEVNLINIQKFYGDVRAVDGVSLNIHDKEFVTLVGPSGCGKTTTLHIVAGLIELDGGEIRIGDRDVSELDPKDRDIAMVFQNYALYPHKSVRDNLEFPLRMRRVDKAVRDQKINQAARILSIEPLLARKPRQLSGGQQQRVALGRAIVRDPAVFLMDEPLSNLDAKLRVQMRTEIKHLQQELQATMIYVTHDQMEAMTMSDRIAIMDRGKVQQYGTPNEVYNKPTNLFVAGFIGSPPMNLIPATRVGSPGAYSLQMNAVSYAPKSPRVQSMLSKASSADVVIGIRHGAISIVPAGTPGSIATHVYTVEPTGDITYVQATIGDKLCTLSTNEHGFHINAGEALSLQLNEDRLYVFDAKSGVMLAE
jgi:multiple sugar transport system ATP-binding protein